MEMYSSLRISASGLSAQRMRLDVIADNIANAETTRTEEGGPYVRKVVSFEENVATVLKGGKIEKKPNGVKVSSISKDTSSEFTTVYDPTNPDADENGNVTYPNVSILNEMVDLITASRAYEANVTAMDAEKKMAMKAIEIGE